MDQDRSPARSRDAMLYVASMLLLVVAFVLAVHQLMRPRPAMYRDDEFGAWVSRAFDWLQVICIPLILLFMELTRRVRIKRLR